MKRRNFLKTLAITSSLLFIGGIKAVAVTTPVKKLLYALKLKKYPGKIKPVGKITQTDKYLG
jgi:hypothetical protein